MRRKTKRKLPSSGKILRSDGTNWVSSVTSVGLITASSSLSAIGSPLSFSSLGGTLTLPTSGQFLSSNGTWVSIPIPNINMAQPDGPTPREDKIFQFNVAGSLHLFNFKGDWELKTIGRAGVWLTARTVITVIQPDQLVPHSFSRETRRYEIKGTTKDEHNAIANAIYEFLYGEKFIEKL